MHAMKLALADRRGVGVRLGQRHPCQTVTEAHPHFHSLALLRPSRRRHLSLTSTLRLAPRPTPATPTLVPSPHTHNKSHSRPPDPTTPAANPRLARPARTTTSAAHHAVLLPSAAPPIRAPSPPRMRRLHACTLTALRHTRTRSRCRLYYHCAQRRARRA